MSITDEAGYVGSAPEALYPPTTVDAVPTPDDAERRRITEAAFARCTGSETPQERSQVVEEVVLANLGVARALAAAHRHKGISREDLEQVAYTALVAAATRFRPHEGRDFLSFAVPTIRGELKRHFRDCGWTVRPPRRVQEIHLQVLAERDRLSKERGLVPTAEEIADELGESVQHVTEALRLDGCFTPSSLDQPLGISGDATLGDLLPEEEGHEESAAEARVILGPAVGKLPPRDKKVVRLRYFEGLTQQEIGHELGVTQTQVSRILGRITRQLRECVEPVVDPDRDPVAG